MRTAPLNPSGDGQILRHGIRRHRLMIVLLLASAAAGQGPTGPLTGIYTVNPTAPPSPTNFPSLSAAASVLSTQGVSGPVLVSVYDDAGPYTASSPMIWGGGSPIGGVGGIAAPPPISPSTAVLLLTSIPGSSPTNTVTVSAALGESPAIDATGIGVGVALLGTDFVTVEGFDVSGAIAYGVFVGADPLWGSAIGNRISRCSIHDCGASGVFLQGRDLIDRLDNTSVDNCFLYSLFLSPSPPNHAPWGYVATNRDYGTDVVHNTFLVNSAVVGWGEVSAMAQWALGTAFSNLVPPTTPWNRVQNNVVLKTTAVGRVYEFQQLCSAIGPPTWSTPTVCDFNCYWLPAGGNFAIHRGYTGCFLGPSYPTFAAWQAATGQETNSMEADPVLVAPLAGDLHLRPGSPCVNSAAVVLPFVASDIDGAPRGPLPDMGADEEGPYGQATSVGSGCAGGAMAAQLVALGRPRLFNQGFAMQIQGGLPGAPGWLFGAQGPATAGVPLGGGCTLYLDIPSMLSLMNAGVSPLGPVPINGQGTATFNLSPITTVSLVGASLCVQSAFSDAGATIGFAITNAVDLVIGY